MFYYLSARRLAFLSFDISIEKFLENSLHLYLMYSHLIMGSTKEEPSPANAWISVLRDSVKCLSCVKELLNFQYVLPRVHSEVGQSFNIVAEWSDHTDRIISTVLMLS